MERQKPSMDNFSKKKSPKKGHGFFFFDAKNENLIVPNDSSIFRYTLNFAQPLAYIFLLVLLLILISITRLFA
ncbi:MAG: hypothetical protein H7098_04035 [Oligoflexus sp.]|nr:hypothetical protein [Pseudopedobacter sp.]